MLRSSLCDYSDGYILVSTTITVPNTAAVGAAIINIRNITTKNCASFTNYIGEINNPQVDNAKDIGIVMPMYNSIAYSDHYSKTSESLWHYYRDKPFLGNDATTNFPANNNSAAFKSNTKIADRTENGTKN